jgi:ATP-binding cassette subfamily B protein
MLFFFRDIPERFRARRKLVRLLRHAGWPMVTLAVGLQLVSGLLPVAFILATSAVVGHVPTALRDGTGSAAWHDLKVAMAVAAVLFLLQTVAGTAQWLVSRAVQRRVDAVALDDLIASSFVPDGIAAHEDQKLAEALFVASIPMRGWDWSPGQTCAGLVGTLSRYTQAAALSIAVGVVFAWWAGAALFGAMFALRFIWRGGMNELERANQAVRNLDRREYYYRELGVRGDAAKELRVFGLLPWVRARYRDSALEAARTIWRWRFRIWFKPFIPASLVSLVLASAALAALAHAAARGQLSLAELALALQAALGTLGIAGYWHMSDAATQEGLRFLTAFEDWQAGTPEPLPATRPAADAEGLPRHSLSFESVRFAYPGNERPVLAGLDLTIEAGRSLAIVGLNGAGKTTLVKLLARLYEPDAGRITVDGIDVRELPARAWQRRIGAIFQDFVHYELPLRDNVAFGAPERADDEESIRSALARVGALEFAEALPAGLDTPLSRKVEGGTELSGGQWQRVAIARALFAIEGGASVLVLDEPTANLDVRAEAEFFERFLELTEGLTTIVISHRFSTVRRAQRIVVLEEGTLIEDGTHDELLALGGRYSELFHLQAARFTDGEAPEADA